MSFLNLPVFAVGSLLIAAPILLHLMMRKKPQHAMFPALRFVQQKQVVNQQRLRLRHWALLALRCAVVLGLAAALARPIVASATIGGWWVVGLVTLLATMVISLFLAQWQRAPRTGLSWVLAVIAVLLIVSLIWLLTRLLLRTDAVLPTGDAEEPLAAVMIFDTSPRMGLVQENQSRMALAQKFGQSMLRQLPSDSQIAVITTQQTGDAFSIDRATAASQIGSLEPGFLADSLPDAIDRGLNLLETAEHERHEVYVFTDLTLVSWPGGSTEGKGGTTEPAQDGEAAAEITHRIAERLSREDGNRPFVYVVDVGSDEPGNLSLGEVRLSREHLPPNSALELQVELHSQGLAATRQVHLFIERPDPVLPMIVNGIPKLPELVLRSQREITIDEGESKWLDFSVRGLEMGTHHGEIRILGEDGLKIDDTRYFTVEVNSAARVLVVPGPGAEPRFLMNALAPLELRENGEAEFRCQTAQPEQLPDIDFSPFAAVVLLDPPSLPPIVWSDLGDYVRRGGGLATFLGRNAKPESLAMPAVTEVLPGTLSRVPWRAPSGDLTLALRENSHPILRVLQPIATSIPWEEFPIAKHWTAKPADGEGHVVLRFSNGKPALLERGLGEGRSLMFTAPISDPLNVAGRKPWARGTDSWPYLVLVNETIKYTAHGANEPLNYLVGQIATLSQSSDDPNRLQMFHPQGSWQEIVARGRRLDIPFTDVPGVYRLKTPLPGSPPRGFAVNLPAATTQLDRIPESDLDRVFGPSNYQIARDEESIERELGVARKGYEFFPWMMLLVVGVLALEHLLSNRFYGNQSRADALDRTRASAHESAVELKEAVKAR